MELPFPGMDPYLERPSLWPDVHTGLIIAIRDALQAKIAPAYVAQITPYLALESIGYCRASAGDCARCGPALEPVTPSGLPQRSL